MVITSLQRALGLALTAAPLLLSCSNTVQKAQANLAAELSGSNEIDYRNVQTFPGGVVCGEYSSWHDYGGSSAYRRFIVRGKLADSRPSEEDWQILCTKDQAAALQATLGIGPINEQAVALEQIRRDIAELQSALDQYLADNYFLPTTAQGLPALLAPSKLPPPPKRFRPGGYLAELPDDPWGQSYHYEREALGGIAQNYRIYTLGADGVVGGSAENADVDSDHLKYLEHLGN